MSPQMFMDKNTQSPVSSTIWGGYGNLEWEVLLEKVHHWEPALNPSIFQKEFMLMTFYQNNRKVTNTFSLASICKNHISLCSL